jgi:predicted AAA+ superfamily ATPase
MELPATRYLAEAVRRDLPTKMAFIYGPRQVGKTTFAKSLSRNLGYLNWDIDEDRTRILDRDFPGSKFWVLDEIHKNRRWRNLLKGLFDGRRPGQKIVVTGSARLDLYKYAGDSLQGRYFPFRLHPFSAAELGLTRQGELDALLRCSGFPEPLYRGEEAFTRRWSRAYRERLVRDELRSVEAIQDLAGVEALAQRLPELVGAPLSINNLAEDLRVAHKTAERWLAALERLYGLFRLAPFGAPRLKAIKKARKHYHFDWTSIPDEPARFETLVAVHLLKWVDYQQDVEGRDYALGYYRDVQGREVDFVVTDGRRPVLAVEAKWAEVRVDRGLGYFRARFPECACWQVTMTEARDRVDEDGIRIAPAIALLRDLV